MSLPAATVSPLVLERVGGLPAEVLDVVGPATRRTLAEHRETQTALDELAARLSDALYLVVPQVPDARQRRRVLRNRRRIHQHQAVDWDGPTRQLVDSLLSPEGRRALRRWDELCGRSVRLRTEIGVHVGADRERVRALLDGALAVPGYEESLAVVAPDWRRWAGSAAKGRDAKSRRTELMYAMRSAAKTSPLSGLTSVRVAGTHGTGSAVSRVAMQDAVGLLYGLASTSPESVRFCAAERVSVRDGGLAMVSLPAFRNGLVYREDQVVRSGSIDLWLDVLGPGELGHEDVMSALGGEQTRNRVARLVESGVLRPVRPWAPQEDPFAALSELPGLHEAVAERLREVGECGAAIATSGTSERLELMARIQELLQDQFADIARPSPAGTVYEDRQTRPSIAPSTVAHARAALTTVAASIRPRIFRSHAYDLLVSRLVARAGVGGSCDALPFLMDMCADEDGDAELMASHLRDVVASADPGDRAWLPVGRSSVKPHVGLYVQSWSATGPGEPSVVVNQVGTGTGSLFARFHGLLGAPVAEAIRDHVEHAWGSSRCYELRVWSDVNTAQAAGSGLLPALVLPGEPGSADDLHLADCRLVHEPRDGTVDLVGADGQVVGVVYLGLLPSFQLPALARWLTILSDQWVNLSVQSDRRSPWAAPPALDDEPGVAFEPRVTEGPVVLRRASWTVRRDALPSLTGPDDVERLVEFDAFRTKFGIPEEVFVHKIATGYSAGAGMHDARKPLWVNLASVDALSMLAGWIPGPVTSVRLTEALPGRSQYTVEDDEGRRYVSENVALVRWDA